MSDVLSIGAGLSSLASAEEAAREAARQAKADLDRPPELAFCFLSPHHLEDAARAADAVRAELEPTHLLGCVAEGVVGRGVELEEGPGVAIWAGAFPGGEVETFHAVARELDDRMAVAGFPALEDPSLVALVVDPYTFPAAPFLGELNRERPGLPLVGGLAAGGRRPGAQALIVDDEIHAEGAIGAILTGVAVRTVVSQGCAPIGSEAVITSAEGNVIHELAGQPALERLRSEIAKLSEGERHLAAQGLLVGLVIDENQAEYGRGDYLMRGLLGADEETGALAVGESVRVGQTLRFHVRDAASADEDLRAGLDEALGTTGDRAAGALLFTCNGRGTSMFPAPHHDAGAVGRALGHDALAGFFCGGEIGPVGGRAFLHGFTATLALFLDG